MLILEPGFGGVAPCLALGSVRLAEASWAAGKASAGDAGDMPIVRPRDQLISPEISEHSFLPWELRHGGSGFGVKGTWQGNKRGSGMEEGLIWAELGAGALAGTSGVWC